MPRKNAKKKSAPQSAPINETIRATLQESIAEAESKLIESDADSALTILNEALATNQTSNPGDNLTQATLLSLLADCYAMLGDSASARDHLEAACEADSVTTPSRFLALAQMLEGDEALKAVKKGIQMLERDLKQAEQSTIDEMQHTLSAAYIACAELYTTDCCDLPEAQSECERSIARAIELVPESLEAHYAQGNLRLILGEVDKAKTCLSKCMEILNSMPDLGSMSALALVDDANEDENDAEDQTDEETEQTINESETPHPQLSEQTLHQLGDSATYEVRMNVAKLAFELQEYDIAVSILCQLSEEDDRFIEVEHMLACALLLSDHVKDALEQAQHALEMVDAILGGEDDEAMEDEDIEYKKSLEVTKRALKSVIADCEAEIAKNPALAESEEDEDIDDDSDDSDDEKRMDADE